MYFLCVTLNIFLIKELENKKETDGYKYYTDKYAKKMKKVNIIQRRS